MAGNGTKLFYRPGEGLAPNYSVWRTGKAKQPETLSALEFKQLQRYMGMFDIELVQAPPPQGDD